MNMRPISQKDILRQVRMQNPWWDDPHTIQAPFSGWPPRLYLRLFEPLLCDRSVRRALVLLGPRRVGKTVMMHHAIQRLLDDGFPPDKILYLSVDHPLYTGRGLESLLDLYQGVTQIDLRTAKEDAFLFFDEIQYLDDWQHHLKAMVDTYPWIKIVASGSAAAALRRQSRESGAGRFTEFLLPPLTFYEYLYVSESVPLAQPVLLWSEDQPSNEDIPRALIPQSRLNELFIEYSNFGGYPEAATVPAVRDNPRRYLKGDIIDQVLLRDLPSLYGIQDTQELNALFTALAFNTAGEVTYEQLATSSGVAKNTIKRYIEYLEAAFLVRKVDRVDASARRFQRATSFKVYLTNPTMRSALFGPLEPDQPEFGLLVETAIFGQWFHANVALHYARWRGGRGKVGIVRLNDRLRPAEAIEVKWSDRIADHPEELRTLLDFCRKNALARTTVTTRTVQRDVDIGGVRIHFVPASLYCLALGFLSIESRLESTP